MKDFVKMTLAVICGIVVIALVFGFLFFTSVSAAIAAGSGNAVIPDEGVLKIDMSKTVIAEQTLESIPFQSFSSVNTKQVSTIGIWDAVQAINAAAEDRAVKYIYLKVDGNQTGASNLSEIRKALKRFKETSGKAIVAYTESPTTASYYLASVADKIYMTPHPGATTMFNGVSAQMAFIGDLLGNLGVNVQLIRHGKYKSAGEMFTRSSSSPENREQYQRMIDSMWETMSAQIAESRGITVEALNDAIDNLKLCLSQDFVDCSLVDELLDRTELKSKLADLAVEDDYDDIDFIMFPDYVKARTVITKAKQKIAVIYADGQIIDGMEQIEIAGDRFASVIEKVRKDDKVKAVVLRVNSPGGSVLASEKIKQQIDLLRESKPVIASYGSMAASGGYWISNACDKIYTDELTLTGSIGVFGMVPDFGKLAKDKLHVGVETVSSNKHGDMWTLMRPFDQAEYNYMLRSIEDIYTRFTTIVAEGRGMDVEAVDAIGQGRVWTGSDAIAIGLADEIGTLEDAIHYAAVAAGDPNLANWKVKGYPAPQTVFEQILTMVENSNSDPYDVLVKKIEGLKNMEAVARLPYELSFAF